MRNVFETPVWYTQESSMNSHSSMYRSLSRRKAAHPSVILTRRGWKGETMSKRTAFWLAWSTWVLYVIIAIVTLLFQMKNAPSELLSDIFGALVLLAFATVGSLIASRRPENPIGWIFCISTLLWALGDVLLNTLPMPSSRSQVRCQQEH